MGSVTPELVAMAKAMAITDGWKADDLAIVLSLGESHKHPHWSRYLNMARAALLTISEPTDAMVDAGFSAVQVGAAVHTPETAKSVARTIIRGAMARLLNEGT